MARPTIFLSHSSADGKLVDALSDLLTTGCGIRGDQIIITTLPGQGIPAGTPNYIAWLQDRLANSALVILLLSPNYFESKFCLCEMGAAWGLEMPCFPLVVPPLKKSEVKAVMAVSQNLNIGDESCLDELRDRVHELLDSKLTTATWTVKRDAFLGKLPHIVRKLPQPDKVERSVLKETEEKYAASMQEVAAKEEQIANLEEQIADLEKCKDQAQVRKVQRKYSSSDEQFEKLCDDAKRALGKLKSATVEALFWDMRGERYVPREPEDWDAVRDAEAINEVSTDERGCEPNTSHKRVSKAQDAVNDLKHFLDTLKDDKFFESFEEEHDFPATVSNKEFWDELL